MVININPERLRTGVTGGKFADRKRPDVKTEAAEEVKPVRAHVNYVPGQESLMTLIRSAVASMRKGKAWDRGSILNLLV